MNKRIVLRWSLIVAMIIGVIAMVCRWGFMGIIYGAILYGFWAVNTPDEK